jgi:formylglycine-generating enzyme required for sulfatase activity
MDRLEVTAGQYQSCQAAGACTPPDTPEPDVRWTWFCTGGQKDKETHPINCLDWNQATAFCAWRGARLPTEAEWEYASRGSDGRTYPWGNAAPSAKVVNACGPECRTLAKAQVNERWGVAYDEDDGHGATAPVGSFPAGASPAGVLDMAGNVREWVADFYGPYPAGPQRDPTGPPTGEHRVVRGGSWNMTMATFLRSAYRSRDHQDLRLWFIGFRCAANPG